MRRLVPCVFALTACAQPADELVLPAPDAGARSTTPVPAGPGRLIAVPQRGRFELVGPGLEVERRLPAQSERWPPDKLSTFEYELREP